MTKRHGPSAIATGLVVGGLAVQPVVAARGDVEQSHDVLLGPAAGIVLDRLRLDRAALAGWQTTVPASSLSVRARRVVRACVVTGRSD